VKATGCCYDTGYPSHPSGQPNLVNRVTLSGGYIAYEAVWSGRGPPAASEIDILNVRTGRTARSAIEETLTDATPLLLSPSGTAAWIWIVEENPAGPSPRQTDMVQVLIARSRRFLTLDTAPHPGNNLAVLKLANLQLYECAGGCGPTATVVAWTDHGSWRYAPIS
jgi:hypothetical protein